MEERKNFVWGLVAPWPVREKHIVAARDPDDPRHRGAALCGLSLAIIDLDDEGVARIASCRQCLNFAWAASLSDRPPLVKEGGTA